MRKILIVEDDTLLNRTLGYNLASDGYEITAAYRCWTPLKSNYIVLTRSNWTTQIWEEGLQIREITLRMETWTKTS